MKYQRVFALFIVLSSMVGCSIEETVQPDVSKSDAGQDAKSQDVSMSDSTPESGIQFDAQPDTNTDTSTQSDTSTSDTSLPDVSPDLITQPDTSIPDTSSDATVVESFGFLSLNLHCLKNEGTPFMTLQDRFSAIAEAVAKEDIRAIAVQEACEQKGIIAMEVLAKALQASTGANWSFVWHATHLAWEGTADESLEGVGVLVRGSIGNKIVLDYKVQGSLFRRAIGAKLPAELGSFYLFSTHLEYESAGDVKAAQGRETASALVTMVDPSLELVVAGDFNSKSVDPAALAMKAYGFVDLTASLDPNRIDHVFAHRGASLGLVSAKQIFTGNDYPRVSDHEGVVARIVRQVPTDVVRTRLSAKTDATWLAFRGDTSPMSWDKGYPGVKEGTGWRIVLTEFSKTTEFQWKVLKTDSVWENGNNHTCHGGDTVEITPSF